MISIRIVLYLIGAKIASCHVLRNGKLCIHGHDKHFSEIITGTKLSPPSIPAFALPFIQQGTNLFYKPQFMTPGTNISPAVPFQIWPTNPEKIQFAIQESQRIPQAPIVLLPPAETKPLQPPKDSHQNVPETIEYAVAELKPAEIPEAPVLPPFEIPELPPVIIPVQSDIQVIEDKPTPEPQPVEIPEAPVLPPFEIPELPVIIPVQSDIQVIEDKPTPEPQPDKIPEAPVLPPFEIPELPPVIIPVDTGIQEFEDKPTPEPRPVHIPEAPVLPPFAIPELHPVVIPIASSPDIPECDDQSAPDLKPLLISEAPVLPPFEISQLQPVIIPVDSGIQEIEDTPFPEPRPVQIPEAPILPPFAIPELPSAIIPIASSPEIPECDDQSAPDFKPLQLPEAPALPNFTVPISISEIPVFVETEPASEFTHIKIPEAPVLLSFTIPKIPSVVGPIASDVSLVPELKPIEIPEAPVLPSITVPELQPDCDDQPAPDYKPILIPEAPSLSPINYPEWLPIINSFAPEHSLISEIQPVDSVPAETSPECDDKPTPELTSIEIPEGPVLPPLAVPEPSVFISNAPETPLFAEVVPESQLAEIPTAPVLPPFILPEIPDNTVSDCEEPTSEPLVIPEAPTLAPVTEILEPVEVVNPTDSNCPPSRDNLEPNPESEVQRLDIPPPPQLPPSEIHTVNLEIIPEVIEYQPLPSIPEAPQLPAFNLLPIPTKIIELEPIEVVDQLKNIPPPTIIPEYEVQEVETRTTLPPAPELPRITITTTQPIVVDSNEEPCRDDQKPLFQQFIQPTFWAQNIIIERVLPNMIDRDDAKSFAAGFKYPVINKPYFVK